AQLRRMAAWIGLVRALDLKIIDTFDFYPVPEGFRGMKERQEFARGPNEDHLHSLFAVIQRTGNEELVRLVEERLEKDVVAHPDVVMRLITDLKRGQPIAGRLSRGHTDLTHANFTRSQIERSLHACGATGGSPQFAPAPVPQAKVG